MNKFTWSGFFFYLRKPHPKGNYYYIICCCESGTVYGWDVVEVRDHHIPMGWPEVETSPNINMVGIILRLTRALWIAGKAVIRDSNLCFLNGLLEIMNMGFYGIALIKRGAIGVTGLMDMALMIASGQNIFVMWYI